MVSQGWRCQMIRRRLSARSGTSLFARVKSEMPSASPTALFGLRPEPKVSALLAPITWPSRGQLPPALALRWSGW